MNGIQTKLKSFCMLIVLSVILFAGAATGMNESEQKSKLTDLLKQTENRRIPLNLYKTMPKAKLAGADVQEVSFTDETDWSYNPRSLAAGQRGEVGPSAGVGMPVGMTSHDLQHNARCTRQIAWRTSHCLHFCWTKKNMSNPVLGAGVRITSYQYWDATTGALKWEYYPNFGGDDLHGSGERSGFCGMDVQSNGAALVYNHYDPDGLTPYNYYPVIWPDESPGAGSWSYKQGVPQCHYCFELLNNWCCDEYLWPYAAFQSYDNGTIEDTIVHVFARADGRGTPGGCLVYWRRFGAGPHPESPGLEWDCMTVDTCEVAGHVVECAQEGVATGYEGKVALVWIAPWPEIPGDAESATPDEIGFLVEQNTNDIYAMISMDGGESWAPKFNVTQTDFTDRGWVPLSDLSALIDSDGRLHVVYSARQCTNTAGGLPQPAIAMDWPLYPLASRIFHWSDANPSPEFITVVRDASQDWTIYDSTCFGDTWSTMSVTKPMISQCDDKLYVVFSQYQDIKNGIWDNCHISNWYGGDYIGKANSMLYFAVSDMSNCGLNWDPARALTDFTPRCDTASTSDPMNPTDPNAISICHSHAWHSITRFGMENQPEDNFDDAVVVNDVSWSQTESPDYFLDLFYVDDLSPGALYFSDAAWVVDPIKWFRVPCVDAVTEPVLALDPVVIAIPAWGKPGEPANYIVKMTNIGNAPLTVSDIHPEELYNDDPAIDGWLSVDESGFGGTISEVIPGNYYDLPITINTGGIVDETYIPTILTGRIIFESDAPGDSDTLNISYIVADSVQLPESKILYTEQISLAVANDGGYGCGLIDTLGQLDFHTLGALGIECDTCSKGIGNFGHKYLYDASPFILTNPAGGPRVSAALHNMDWLSRHDGISDGLRPQEGMGELIEGPVVDRLETGLLCSADSSIGMICTYLAPQTPDTNRFIIQVIKAFNRADATIDELFLGTVEDWDIPSDTGVRNWSYFDDDRKLFYMYGFEGGLPDTFCGNDPLYGNDCIDANLRFGGSAVFGGYHFIPGENTISYVYRHNHGAFTTKTASWLGDMRGHLPADRLYDTLSGPFFGYSAWIAIDGGAAGPESLVQDLTMISSFGQFSLGVEDTLVFIKFLASEYNGGLNGIRETIDKAKAFTLHYLCCDMWGMPGDILTDHSVNILDIVQLINYIYKSGPGVLWPDDKYDAGTTYDNCDNMMNVNEHEMGDGLINILDIVYLINYIYKNGPAPTCPYSI